MRVGDTQYGGNLDLNYNKIVNLRDSGTRVPNDVVWDNLEDFELIGHTELSSDTATIDFSNIPGRYKHLLVVGDFRASAATAGGSIFLQFNSDTGTNYDAAHFVVNAAATLSGTGEDGPGAGKISSAILPAANAPSSSFAPNVWFIPDYSNTARHKSAQAVGGRVHATADTTGQQTSAASGRWRNTNAITSLQLKTDQTNFVSGTTVSLYGIRSKRFLIDPTNTLCDDLIAYWKLDETGGTRLDSWGANHLTDNNTVTYARGIRGRAARFFASNTESLSITDNTDLSMGDIDATIAAWFYVDKTPDATRHIVAKNASADREYYLSVLSTSKVYTQVRNTANNANGEVTSTNSIVAGAWNFVVWWHDASNDQLGLQINNGAPDTASYSGGIRDSANAFYVGSGTDANNEWNGLIQNVGFWKKVLTPAERTALFNRGRGNTLINT